MQKLMRVTVWYEFTQESGELRRDFFPEAISDDTFRDLEERTRKSAEDIRKVYPEGVMGTLAAYLSKQEDMEVTYTNMYLPEYGLPDDLLQNTDVLIWWAHISHDVIPDVLVKKIVERVQMGMGFLPLHSAHKSKPFMALLGTSGSLKWREGDFCRIWTIAPAHPIAAGIPESIELEEEEMYGEPFDIPKPDDTVFLSWYRGGEVFRSGCTWTRGYGKIFYFQAGHETSPSYHNKWVLKIIENAVRWAAPALWRENLDCPNALEKPEIDCYARG